MRFLAVLLAALPAGFAAADGGVLETRVSIRTIGLGLIQRESSPPALMTDSVGGVSQSVLRLEVSGRPAAFARGEAHLVGGMDLISAQGVAPGLSPAGSALRHRILAEEWEWVNSPDLSGWLGFDRLNVKLTVPLADVTIGRQAVNFSKAYFWNPLDVFLAFDSRQFDRDYKTGVDALRLDLAVGDLSGLNLVWAGGREIGADGAYARGEQAWGSVWCGSALLGRMHTALAGWDTAVQGGKVYGGSQIGLGISGEAGPFEMRAEAAWLDASGSVETVLLASGPVPVVEDNFQAVLGLGRRLTDRITLQGEYFLNGAGLPNSLDASLIRVASGHSLHLGRHLAGVQGSFQAHPLVSLSLAWIGGLEDASGLVQPGLMYSLADEAELLAGAQLNYGRVPEAGPGFTFMPRSEFGTYPHVVYGELKFYF